MVLTVSNLYKVAKALEKDEEVLKLCDDWKNADEDVNVCDIVVSVINNAGIVDTADMDSDESLFENESLEITTYNGRLYYAVYNEKGKKSNANLTDDILKQHKMTDRGEAFIKKYLPVENHVPSKNKYNKDGNKKKFYKKNNNHQNQKKEAMKNTEE